MASKQQDRRDSIPHWVITDSGLGGLATCAQLERNFRLGGIPYGIRMTYFNAWPEQGRGYNDLPDAPSRARIFNRALVSMGEFRPDRILIACNTLSVLYPMTEFSRTAAVPVLGIVDAGVDLFFEALSADPLSSLLMFGTRTTIESGVHRDALLRKGIHGKRITAVSCHGLATAIETDPGGATVAELIERCVSEACQPDLADGPLYAGLCCTHYSYVKGLFRSVLERRSGKRVDILDPNDRMVRCLVPETGEETAGAARSAIVVDVISQVALDGKQAARGGKTGGPGFRNHGTGTLIVYLAPRPVLTARSGSNPSSEKERESSSSDRSRRGCPGMGGVWRLRNPSARLRRLPGMKRASPLWKRRRSFSRSSTSAVLHRLERPVSHFTQRKVHRQKCKRSVGGGRAGRQEHTVHRFEQPVHERHDRQIPDAHHSGPARSAGSLAPSGAWRR